MAAAAASFVQSQTKSVITFGAPKAKDRKDSEDENTISCSEMTSFVAKTNSVSAVVVGLTLAPIVIKVVFFPRGFGYVLQQKLAKKDGAIDRQHDIEGLWKLYVGIEFMDLYSYLIPVYEVVNGRSCD
ncbi:uncharacterized protein A4U43_C04F28680 [Asparagus officinalis]|uniref:Uncharacterized protein n=1 Tax=Asparagus officinalis TaxID=4686 RepID=A0A5P1F4D6_ASPOF|nr:uncharacterized protein A4U43_C04F28680 [Asparagus officinalis]